MKSNALGIKNLKRLVPMLVPATTQRLDDVSYTKEGYNELVGQFVTEMRHVATIPGSSTGQEKYGSQPGAREPADIYRSARGGTAPLRR